MGAGLLMEALRQTAVRGDRRTLDRIGGVMLISPDIDAGPCSASRRMSWANCRSPSSSSVRTATAICGFRRR